MTGATANAGDGVSWRVFGGVEVIVHGESIPLTRQAAVVLGRLLAEPGRPMGVERLVGTESTSTVKAAAAGRVAVSRLRRLLDAHGVPDAVATTEQGYQLQVEPESVDHVRFSRQIEAARNASCASAALVMLESAIELWRGEPFGTQRDDHDLDLLVHALEEQRRAAVELWGQKIIETGDIDHNLARLETATAEEPLRERRWENLIRAHYALGNQAEALRAYERARSTLLAEVGIEPGPRLRDLATAVARQDPSLTVVVRPPAAGTPAPASGPHVMIGRDDDVLDLTDLVERHRLVELTGFAGVGKTTLAAEMATRNGRPSLIVSVEDSAPGELLRDIAATAGVGRGGAVDIGVVATRLDASGTVLVLDGCDDAVGETASVTRQILDLTHDARIATTSRVPGEVAGAVDFLVEPLPLGNPDDPGPAALLAADHAGIRASRLTDSWMLITSIVRHAGGIPLAVRLLARRVAFGAAPEASAVDEVMLAVKSTLGNLSALAHDVAAAMADLPDGTSVAQLAGVLDREVDAVRMAAAEAVCAGVLVRHSADRQRFSLLEPARSYLTSRRLG